MSIKSRQSNILLTKDICMFSARSIVAVVVEKKFLKTELLVGHYLLFFSNMQKSVVKELLNNFVQVK